MSFFEKLSWSTSDDLPGMQTAMIPDDVECPDWYHKAIKLCCKMDDGSGTSKISICGSVILGFTTGKEYGKPNIFIEKPHDMQNFLRVVSKVFDGWEIEVSKDNGFIVSRADNTIVNQYGNKINIIFDDPTSAIDLFCPSINKIGIYYQCGNCVSWLFASEQTLRDIDNKCFTYPLFYDSIASDVAKALFDGHKSELGDFTIEQIERGVKCVRKYFKTAAGRGYSRKLIVHTKYDIKALVFNIKLCLEKDECSRDLELALDKFRVSHEGALSLINEATICMINNEFDEILYKIECKEIVTADGSGHIRIDKNTTCDLISFIKSDNANIDKIVYFAVKSGELVRAPKKYHAPKSYCSNPAVVTRAVEDNAEIVDALKNAAAALCALADKIGK